MTNTKKTVAIELVQTHIEINIIGAKNVGNHRRKARSDQNQNLLIRYKNYRIFLWLTSFLQIKSYRLGKI